MEPQITDHLVEQRLLSAEQGAAIANSQRTAPVSVHWELRSLLYLGIVLFTTGAGILIYKNIDTIGHTAIISFIGICCIACYVYCFRKSAGFTAGKAPEAGIWPDYVLLLGSLLMLSFLAYLQFQYNIFGHRWGLATFIPLVILFASAYYFDHLGILSMAITNLAAWAGINATPMQLITQNEFNEDGLVYTAIALGIVLVAMAYLSSWKNFKAHFCFTYKNFGAHLLMVSLLAGMFMHESLFLVWLLAFAAVAAYFFIDATRTRSYYFFVITLLYSYVALCYLVVRTLMLIDDGGGIYLGLLYFIFSGVALIIVLIRFNKKFKADDSLS